MAYSLLKIHVNNSIKNNLAKHPSHTIEVLITLVLGCILLLLYL